MGLLTEQRRTHLERTLPPAEDTRQRIRTYLAKADMKQSQFAALMNRSVKGLEQFLGDRYGAEDLLFREDAEATMERHPVGIASTTAQERLYETENVIMLRRWFEHCHSHRALAFVYGPPGSQKTFVGTHLVAEFNRRELSADTRNFAYYVRASVNIQPRDLVAKMCVAAGAATGNSLQRCMAGLRQRLGGTKTVFMMDEMQLAGISALEAIRELNEDGKGVGILLMGSHRLKAFFDERAAELEQWNSRLDAGVELSGVSDACARSIVELELPDLDGDQITALLEGSRVADIYSRDRNRTYLSMRRMFKSIAALRQLSADAQEATA